MRFIDAIRAVEAARAANAADPADLAAARALPMERVNLICSHPQWQEAMEKLRRLEEGRIFCGHDTQHFLDVARIAYIEALERGLPIPKDMIYAAALLHDIGRYCQYEEGIPHEEASGDLAARILPECGFSSGETEEILGAIRLHRSPATAEREDLADILYRADKKSRECMFCEARGQCSWPEEKKNMKVTV